MATKVIHYKIYRGLTGVAPYERNLEVPAYASYEDIRTMVLQDFADHSLSIEFCDVENDR